MDVSVMQPDGRLKRLRAAFPTKTEAQAHLALIHSRKAMQRLGIEVPEVKSHDVLFEDFAEKVLDRASGKRAKTCAGRRICLNALASSEIFKGKRLSEITTDDVANYHTARGAEKKASANAELGFLKTVLRRAVEWAELARNPADPVKRFKIEPNRLRVLTGEETDLLLNAADPALVPVLRILLATGMRPHEVFALHWERDGWDTDNGLRDSIVALGRRMIFVPGLLAKNHKDREVPLSRELVEMFETLPRDPNLKGKIFRWVGCPREFGEAVRVAKLKNVTLYTLKHTCASDWINKDRIDIVTVSEMLGHSDIKITMRYCHSNKMSKWEAVEKASRRIFKDTTVVDAPVIQPAAQVAEAVN
jgi:integrase